MGPLTFLRATAVPAEPAEARISYGDSVCPSLCLSVRLSVRHDPVQKQPSEIDSGFSHSLESLASNEVILVPLGEAIPLERGHQTGVVVVVNA